MFAIVTEFISKIFPVIPKAFSDQNSNLSGRP